MDGSGGSELGAFLRSRREQLPVEQGCGGSPVSGRRRTPGARRSEIATRANISVEWYTRLEQGRGGQPSRLVLDAVCDALQLSAEDREHVALLARGSSGGLVEGLGPAAREQLQRILDRLDPFPAYIKSPSWDVLLWNTTAATVLSDYAAMAPADRNILRILFLDPESPRRIRDWHTTAALTVSTFRAELVRWGDRSEAAAALIGELTEASQTFRELWSLHHVGRLGEGDKTFRLPDGEYVTMRYESLSLDEYRGLGLVIYTPVEARV